MKWLVGDDQQLESAGDSPEAIKMLRDWYATGDWSIWQDNIELCGGPKVDVCRIARKAARRVKSRGVRPDVFAQRLQDAIGRELYRAGVRDIEGGNRPTLHCVESR